MFEAEVCLYMQNISHILLERCMKTKKTKHNKTLKGEVDNLPDSISLMRMHLHS